MNRRNIAATFANSQRSRNQVFKLHWIKAEQVLPRAGERLKTAASQNCVAGVAAAAS